MKHVKSNAIVIAKNKRYPEQPCQINVLYYRSCAKMFPVFCLALLAVIEHCGTWYCHRLWESTMVHDTWKLAFSELEFTLVPGAVL